MIREAKRDVETRRAEVALAASEAKTNIVAASGSAKQEITELSLKALESWKAQLQAEAKSQMQDFTSTVEKAKADAAPKISAELGSIAAWGNEQKHVIENAVNAQQTALAQLTPGIEQAKAAVVPQIQAEMQGIRDWGKTKRDEISTATDGILAELTKFKDDSSSKIREQINSIPGWGTEQKRILET